MKLHVNDSFNIRSRSLGWCAVINGKTWTSSDPLTEALEYFIGIYEKSQLTVNINDQEYNALKLPSLLPWQLARVDAALGCKYLDLTIRVDDKVRFIKPIYFFKKGAIATVIRVEGEMIRVCYESNDLKITSCVHFKCVEKL